ncbi:MAG: 30S ribosomal protein S16 [Candidatus Uhrbacteria bacterium GW2011_GWF2_41_16]|uniref:Small ribosomal subunit protein bS16 n=2 Tax=Candidatus Uhriibacteriota TaxID=1752732 RepID=A0A0G0VBP5_9BACT|nr:MAG: 30S ribosomal protein S16 [Candidatus Uhrbacteria bacterium GW2011_GWC2_41_11]KKR98353.1 MAG: 30S ribosomal protein S16 [Candidatus Uhrbacteria bacterium GW2011_GWF2_41_16]HBP00077.1 30S ribosomal protein S16 [Candidatus Uhrbacteria bacterium]
MLSIRMTRVGKKGQPTFRVILTDKRKDPWGKAIEILGHRNPRTKETVLNAERIKHWLGKGAQATDTVWNFLLDQKLVEGKKRGVTHLSKKRQEKIATKQSETKV